LFVCLSPGCLLVLSLLLLLLTQQATTTQNNTKFPRAIADLNE
jgi:hypothetical protein